ncbi:MAG: branched-chain amino acid ABC transporter permease, partial [Candidatus Eremiobacteraeota bacterium]|nr:branched-chain amino acid ABC transporter permease [Candidatus Eremiobacteraeota bacterium]
LIVSGVLAGLVFALIAMGLTLIFGVMDVVNFAHGEFLMVAMYLTLGLSLVGIQPVLALPVVAFALFVFGAFVYRVFVRRLLEGPPEATIFGTFGLLVLLQGLAQYFLTSDLRSVPSNSAWFTGAVQVGTIRIGQPELTEAIGALAIAILLYLFIEYTETGRGMRATSEDRIAATLMGVDVQRMNLLAFGIGCACAGAAGALLMLTYQVYPRVGSEFALTAFVVVALGGFGSIQGAFVGAILVGLVEVLGGFYISPAVKLIPVYLLYLVVVLLRPQGLLGRR